MLTRDDARLLSKLVQQAESGYVHTQAAELQITASDVSLKVTALAFCGKPNTFLKLGG